MMLLSSLAESSVTENERHSTNVGVPAIMRLRGAIIGINGVTDGATDIYVLL